MTTAVPRVAYQGQPGAYGEEAVLAYFGEGAVEPLPLPTFSHVMAAVDGRHAEAAVLPLENSLAGTVGDALDALLRTDLVVSGEVVLPVRHLLLGLPGSRLGDVRQVTSHWQALAQCERFLTARNLQVTVAPDTAGAARQLRDSRDRSTAVIASPRAAQRYGLNVLAEEIGNAPQNLTRFAVVGVPGVDGPPPLGVRAPSPDAPMVSLVLFETLHRPGALHHALGALAQSRINLSRIESRPTDRARWEYRFLISVDGSAADDPLRSALANLAQRAHAVRLVGSFRSASADQPGTDERLAHA